MTLKASGQNAVPEPSVPAESEPEMSYSSSISLSLVPDRPLTDTEKSSIAAMINSLDVFTEKRNMSHCCGFLFEYYEDCGSWSEYEEDMLQISKAFPFVRFNLEIHGEIWDDILLHYYKNGKVMRNGLEIIRRGYNEKFLREPERKPK